MAIPRKPMTKRRGYDSYLNPTKVFNPGPKPSESFDMDAARERWLKMLDEIYKGEQ